MKPRTSGEQAAFKKAVFKEHVKNDGTGRPYLECCFCGGRIDPATQEWHAAHGLARFFGGSKGAPAHPKCHMKETGEKDLPAIAKSKRRTEKHMGIKRRTSRPLPGTKASGWKRKMSGEWEKR